MAASESSVRAQAGPRVAGFVWIEPLLGLGLGAMGGALISLSGTIAYRLQWNHDFDYWHYVRPWVGGIIGSLGALVLIVLIQLSTTTTSKLDHLALYVVAFIVGYREQSFRDLIKRAGDLLLAPGQSPNQSGQQAPGNTP